MEQVIQEISDGKNNSQQFFTAAMEYLSKGVNVVPVTKFKEPVGKWRHLQTQTIKQNDLLTRLSDKLSNGLALICGSISGNLEGIDVDTKNDLTGTLWGDLCWFIKEHDHDLFY